MIPMSPTNSRIFELKFNFLTFAWANHRWEVPGSDANILSDFQWSFETIPWRFWNEDYPGIQRIDIEVRLIFEPSFKMKLDALVIA